MQWSRAMHSRHDFVCAPCLLHPPLPLSGACICDPHWIGERCDFDLFLYPRYHPEVDPLVSPSRCEKVSLPTMPSLPFSSSLFLDSCYQVVVCFVVSEIVSWAVAGVAMGKWDSVVAGRTASNQSSQRMFPGYCHAV